MSSGIVSQAFLGIDVFVFLGIEILKAPQILCDTPDMYVGSGSGVGSFHCILRACINRPPLLNCWGRDLIPNEIPTIKN